MSGQHPQPGPWYGQQGPGPWSGPPVSPKRRTGWIVVAVVAVLALLAGGGIAAWQLTGSSDDDSSATDEPSSPDDPTPTDEPAEPTSAPASAGTDPWGAIAPDAEVNDVSDALEGAGYACYNTSDAAMLTPDEPITVNDQNVLVRRCYLDPATSRDEEQTVSLQVAPDGSVNGIRVVIEAFLHNNDNRTTRWFGDVVRALTGPVLTSSEAQQVRAGRTPDLAWGTAALDTNAERTSYQLDLTAEGSGLEAVPATNTGLSLAQIRSQYASKGFSCRDVQPKGVVCERTGQGHRLIVSAVDPCHGGNAGSLVMCAGGKTVGSLTFDAEFNAGLPERVYTTIFDDFILDSLIFSFQDKWTSQIDSTLSRLGMLKRHRADFEGLQVEVLPHTTGSFDPQYEQAYEIHIEGVCATGC